MTSVCLLVDSHDILEDFDSYGTAAPLYFTEHAPDSRFLQSWDLDLVLDVLKQPLTRESHTRGISLNRFDESDRLKDFFKPLSLSVDKEGKVWAPPSAAAQQLLIPFCVACLFIPKGMHMDARGWC